jgi:outer membrane receptor protein involved in Fe transport
MQNVVATIGGDLGFASPAAETPVQVSLGLEYRRDLINAVVDENFATGNASGQGGPTLPLSGETDVFEIFGEMRIPLIEGAAFAELMSLELAYRYSDYDSGINTDTYKVGADWAPTEDIRFRGSFQHAVRAANVVELFTAQGFNLFDMGDDPCGADDAEDGTASAAACIGTNPWQVTAGQYGSAGLNSPAGQYNFLQGGNTFLQPEEADTYTVGFVFTPRFLPGLNVSLDYFNIEVENLISTVGAVNTLTDCYDNGNLASCALIQRNPGTGQLWIGAGNVIDLNTNIGGLVTSGYDINANYSMDIGAMGGLSFQLIGTLMDELITDPGAGQDPYECVGFFGTVCSAGTAGAPTPEWRHRFRVSWDTPWDLSFSGTWRHFGEVTRITGANTPAPTGLPDSAWDSQDYFDLAGNWQVYENTNIRFGMNNVFDSDPPLSAAVGTTGNGNTFPQTYDALGRWIFVGATVDF